MNTLKQYVESIDNHGFGLSNDINTGYKSATPLKQDVGGYDNGNTLW